MTDLFSKAQAAVGCDSRADADCAAGGDHSGLGAGRICVAGGGCGFDCVRGDSALSAIDRGGALGQAGAGNDWRSSRGRDAGTRSCVRGLRDGAGDVSRRACWGCWGCRTLIVTNAAGGIRADIAQGSLVAISDHINLTGTNAALGPNEPRFACAPGAGRAVLRHDGGLLAQAAQAGAR